ncbi:hypothetical protein [Halapricum desulfuricans]|uniref:Cell surface protein n=1 Tax=Halapricum desulfuricans TaxID=2841257 RepID=A0A897N480_9EURY|nr:hypothetical protein [Halapricum desulfuricans]QSG05126.1 Cell surface protein [Halapricum desulfuricans]
MNESLFPTLWSGDLGRFVNESDYRELTGESRTPLEIITNATDIPLDRPPEAVERWNRGDLRDVPETNQSVSIGPPTAERARAAYIEDAFVSIFAIQPSTRAHLTPDDTPLYVGDTGSVLALVDYRVDLRDNHTVDNVTYRWRLDSHQVQRVRLLVDGELENETLGSQTPELGFDELAAYPGVRHNLTIEADIAVAVERSKDECLERGANGTCGDWQNETWQIQSALTVTDSRDVTRYRLGVSGYETSYPNGDQGLELYMNRPWLGFETPAGTVRGSWRFYTARDRNWDALRVDSTDGSRQTHSPMHPLQVYAFPMEGGPTIRSTAVTLLDSYGVEMDAPELQPDVYLDVAEDTYTASYGLVVRVEDGSEGSEPTGAVQGLVRGVERPLSDASLATVPLIETELRLSVDSIEDGIATVEISLREASSGRPIETSSQPGVIQIDGTTVDTGPDGTTVQRVSIGNGIVSARYVPEPWWRHTPGYLGDSDAVFASHGSIDIVNAIYQIGIPIGLLLIAAFLVDRITGIPIWPPWRH